MYGPYFKDVDSPIHLKSSTHRNSVSDIKIERYSTAFLKTRIA